MIDIFALFLLLLTFFVSKVRIAEMLTQLDFKMMLFLNPNLGGGSKNYHTSHCLKPVKIMLETLNLACKYTPICSFRKYTFQCLAPLNFADVSIFLQKNQRFLSKKVLYSKQQCQSCVRNFLVLPSIFVRTKVTVIENITFADSVSGIWPPDCSKLAKNPKK